VNDHIAGVFSRNGFGDRLRGFPGWEVTEFTATIITHDPIVEVVVWQDMK
jgi:hypothetical protein